MCLNSGPNLGAAVGVCKIRAGESVISADTLYMPKIVLIQVAVVTRVALVHV